MVASGRSLQKRREGENSQIKYLKVELETLQMNCIIQKGGRQRGKNNENLNEIDTEARREDKDDRKKQMERK